jgi:hypothetical protein
MRACHPDLVHLLGDEVSSRMADAAGFPDRGWQSLAPDGS